MTQYTPPIFTNSSNELTAELTHEAIKLAKDNSDLLNLCSDAILAISSQILTQINKGIELEHRGAFSFTEGRILDPEAIELITNNLVLIHKVPLTNYIQQLAKTLSVHKATVYQYADITRSAIIYNGLLHLIAHEETIEPNTNPPTIQTVLKVPKDYNSDGITPSTYRDITYEDVISSVQKLLENDLFITELMNKLPL